MADGRVVIDVILEDGSVAKGVADVDRSLGGIGNSAEKASLSIGKIASALGLVFIAKKGIDMVRDSLDGAIDRYDTLNQFPRVLQLLGFDAQETDAAIQKLSDGIDGLPTTLDSVASTAQNIAVMTGDLDGAVDTTLALNNAFLASGASTADAERGLQQYVQMLSKGEVDLQSWRTLQETMGVALNKLAEEFGFTGESAQNDLYDALKSGEITFDEFNAKLIEASNAQGGFADMAKEASGGIKTSWTNVKTAVVKGVADIIEAIDKSLGGVGSIEGILDNLKEGIKTVFAEIVKQIPIIINDIKSVYNALEPWMPLIKGIATAVGIFIGAFAGIQTVIGIVNKVRNAIMLMNAALMANPVGLVVAAIITAVALIYVYWEPISEFFVNLWNTIKETGLTIWENLKEGWNNAVENVKDAWDSVASFFVGLWNSITEGATSIWDTVLDAWSAAVDFILEIWSTVSEFVIGVWDEIVGAVSVAVGFIMEIFTPMISFFSDLWSGVQDSATSMWDNMTNLLSTIWSNIQNIASNAWTIIKNVILGPILLLINLVTGDMEEFKSNLSAIWGNIAEAAGEIWDSIKEIVVTYIETLVENALIVWELFKETLFGYWDAILETTSNIWGVIVDFIFNAFDSIEETVASVMDTILEKIADAWNFIYELWETILGAVMDTTSENFQTILDNIHMIMEDIWIVIENVWNFIKETFLNVLAFIKALVTGDFGVMKDMIGEQMTLIRNTISNIWAAIKNIFSSVLAILKAAVSQAWNNIKSTTSSVFNSVMSTIKSIWNSIKSFFTVTLVDIWNTVKQKFTDIVNSVKDKMDETKQKIEDGWNNAVEFLKGIDLKQIGKDIIQGLINGITSKVKAVGDAMKSVTDAVTGKVKSILKIASPSKLFKQFGGWLSEGLAIGITNMQGMAEKASEKLGLGVEGAFEPSLEIDGVGALDELKGLSANQSIGKLAATSTSNVNHIINSANKRRERNIIYVKPSTVEMDGRTVGNITWEIVDENIERNNRITGKFKRG